MTTHPDSGRIITSGDVINDLHDEIAQLRGTRKVLWNLLGECLPVIDALMQIPGDDDSDAHLNGLAGRINDARTVVQAEELPGATPWAKTPQQCSAAQAADSVPAVSDLPPLPAPDLRDVGTKPQEIKEFLKGYATEYARTAIAARAPADSVQEDAALLDWLEQHDGRYYNLDKVASIVGTGFLVQSEGNMPQVHSTLREAVYAARKQGARWKSAVRALTLHI